MGDQDKFAGLDRGLIALNTVFGMPSPYKPALVLAEEYLESSDGWRLVPQMRDFIPARVQDPVSARAEKHRNPNT
jgi:hypothetical protein